MTSRLKGSATAKLAKLWEQAHILFKTEDGNSSPETVRVKAASAGREPDGRVCFPSIPSGRRPSCKSSSRIRRGSSIREEAEVAGLPIISIETKKKEMLGNFKREGKALSNGPLKSLDHDFSTFSDGQIVPHGIYDVTRNVGYMTLGISHDTSKFVCDNIARVWREYLNEQTAVELSH